MSSVLRKIFRRTGREIDSIAYPPASHPNIFPATDRSPISVEGLREARRRQWTRYLMEMYEVAANR